MKNLSENQEKGILFSVLIIIVLIIIFGINKQCEEDQEIRMFKGVTEATITKFQHENLTYYYIEYEYLVEGKTYIGSVGVEKFKCENGKLGCVGEKFKVNYSTKDPSKNTIDLGIYEKYKRTVEF
ncbi:hypothetical protein KO566_08825 [Flavobacteriaceae bacterium XHP0103]|uniref:hypothetical protein n=1 Tax=Marixanthotalea marina TaxID=2844359 RepID=UPI002989E490|nr:hypothetical protein [Marixanthotalea marina]MBU3822160.1 hypothetical protein [Marixanthotalea marina]